MKKKITLLLLSTYLLSSCTLINPIYSDSESGHDSISQEESLSESEESESIESVESSEEIESDSSTEESSDEESESESESESSSESSDEILNVTIYASNDIHGDVLVDYDSMGLENYGTFMKMKGAEPNTLTLDQGDTWQGSIYSNINHGKLINDVMCEAKLSARTIGNHDFDWGIDKLVANTNRSYNDYTIPVLAANVYDYDFVNKIPGDTFQSDIGRKSIYYDLENGLRVGIVGVIGKDQITSISSQYVENIFFKDHIEVIKEEATKLRNIDNCDIVIASAHTGQEDLLNNNLSNYVDLVLCGHTHKMEISRESGVVFAQFGANGDAIGEINLEYDTSLNKVTSTTCTSLDASDVMNIVIDIDPTIHSLVTTSNAACEEEANEVLASSVYGSFQKSVESVNVMCKAILDKAFEEGHDDIILSYCNTARAYLPRYEWTYSNLYDSFPFDNLIYIIEVTGSEIKNEVMRYNNVCRSPYFDGNISINGKYKIACIDYLAYHTDSNRYYDYFPDNAGQFIDVLSMNYRHILREWLRKNGYNAGKTINASDFSSYLNEFSTDFNIIYS